MKTPPTKEHNITPITNNISLRDGEFDGVKSEMKQNRMRLNPFYSKKDSFRCLPSIWIFASTAVKVFYTSHRNHQVRWLKSRAAVSFTGGFIKAFDYREENTDLNFHLQYGDAFT